MLAAYCPELSFQQGVVIDSLFIGTSCKWLNPITIFLCYQNHIRYKFFSYIFQECADSRHFAKPPIQEDGEIRRYYSCLRKDTASAPQLL